MKPRYLRSTIVGFTAIAHQLFIPPDSRRIEGWMHELRALSTECEMTMRPPLDRFQRIVSLSAYAIRDEQLYGVSIDMDLWIVDDTQIVDEIVRMLVKLNDMVTLRENPVPLGDTSLVIPTRFS